MKADPYLLAATFLLVILPLFGCTEKKRVNRWSTFPQPLPTATPIIAPAPDRHPTTLATQRPYTIAGTTYYPMSSANGYKAVGIASWYGPQFHGKKTANGEVYDMHQMTAAHKTLPMDTMLQVRHLGSGREITVRINDRGPFLKERIIDFSYEAARRLEMVKNGTARVAIKALAIPSGKKYYVQVGAFRTRENARHLENQIKVIGGEVIILEKKKSEITWYRVLVFGGHSMAQANITTQKFIRHGYKGAFATP